MASCCVRCWRNLSQSTCHKFNLGEIGLWAVTVSSVYHIGKWAVHGGWRLGCVKHWVTRMHNSLLQKTLSGHVRFLEQGVKGGNVLGKCHDHIIVCQEV